MEPAHLQRSFQGGYGRVCKKQSRGKKKSTQQVGKPFHRQRQSRHPETKVRRQLETRTVQTLVTLQKLVHPARAEAETGAEVRQTGLSEVREVFRHVRRFAGKQPGGEKHGQLSRSDERRV